MTSEHPERQEISTMTPTDIQPATSHPSHLKTEVEEVIVYGHSALLYWWPLWATGYIMALLTWANHAQINLGDNPQWFHPSRNLGVIYTLMLVLLIVITSTNVRGMKAAFIIAGLSFFALLFAYLGWWEEILNLIGREYVYMNFGFYLFCSTVLCVTWFITVFVVDHLSFWRFRPGQITREYLGGIVDKSYDTDNLILLKKQDDLFRHWILGLGSGDIHMETMGGRGVEMHVANVLFVIGKLGKIQRLVATKPNLPKQA